MVCVKRQSSLLISSFFLLSLKRRTEAEGEGETTGLKGSDQQKQNNDGWTVIVGKKSKSAMHKPTLDRKEQSVQQHKDVDQLCEINLRSPPRSYRQSVGQKSSVSDEQDTSSCNAESSESTGGNNACGEAKSPISVTPTQVGNITRAENLKEVPSTLSSSAQEPLLSSEKNQQTVPSDTNSNGQQFPMNVHSSNGQQPVPMIAPPGFATPATPFPVVPPELISQYLCSLSSESTGGNNACGEAKSPISVTPTQVGNITRAENLKEVPSTLSSSAQEPLLSSEKNQQTVPSDTNSNGQQFPMNVHSSNGQQPVPMIAPPGFATPATPFPVVPPELISQYLCSLQMIQNGVASGGELPKNSAPLRRPPGLNTEPVPEGEAPEHSPPSAGKFSSFDKLMEALQKRFPSKTR